MTLDFEPLAYGLLILFLSLSSAVAVLKICEWVLLWQIKEYRSDRMIHFLATTTGRIAVMNIFTRGEFLFFILFLIMHYGAAAGSTTLLWSIASFILFLLMELAAFLRNPRLPAWTVKALFLIATSCIVLVLCALLFYHYSQLSEMLIAASLLLLSPLIVCGIVILLRPITTIQHQRTVQEASKRIEELQPTVIGIAGSYGKTTTKEFLTTILSQKFHLLATPNYTNTDLGVARTILTQLQPDHEIMIVEMGARSPGEIRMICRMSAPIIGVLTGTNEHQLTHFGNHESTQATPQELLTTLPSSGLAVMNADNQESVEIASTIQCKTVFFSTEDIAHIYTSDSVVGTHDISFFLHIGDEKIPCYTRLHGKQVLSAICAAAAVADYLGMTSEAIVRGIEKLQPVPGAMQLHPGVHHSTIIDNRYSANPNSCMAALDYLDIFHDKRKIVIMPGMSELGTESDNHHRTIGARIGEVADLLIITKEDHAKPLSDAARQAGLVRECVMIDTDPKRLAAYLRKQCTADDVILMEGMLHPTLRQSLIVTEDR